MNLVLVELTDGRPRLLSDFGPEPDWNAAYRERDRYQELSLEKWPHVRYCLRWQKARAAAA